MIFKTIAKPEGFVLTENEFQTVTNQYVDSYLTATDKFVNWSSSKDTNKPVTPPVTMDSNKNFYPSIQAAPVVQFVDNYHGGEAWIPTNYEYSVLDLVGGEEGEDYFQMTFSSSVELGKYMIGVIGRNSSTSAWGGDFGQIDLDAVLSAENGVKAFQSNDNTRTKTLKVSIESGSHGTAIARFVVYNAAGVAVSRSDLVDSSQLHELLYRKLS